MPQQIFIINDFWKYFWYVVEQRLPNLSQVKTKKVSTILIQHSWVESRQFLSIYYGR
jgi:hypothetical protein